jgi:peptidoglycan/LPS O-acetylase OafA/YrhL
LTVDFARGLLAAGVFAYHVLYNERIAEAERVAYYAVYGFFVISGFALYVTYRDRLGSLAGVADYLRRRFFRIAPLYYFAAALHLLLLPHPADLWYRAFLNFTLLFGFANPGATSLVGGGWSIGIELVFYVLFPVIIAAAGASLPRLGALAGVATVAMIWFANHALADHPTMATVWAAYTQPIAFFGYFAAGCLIGELFLRYGARLKGHPAALPLAALALTPFVVVHADYPTGLLTGWTGVVLTASTIGFVAAVAFMAEPRGGLRVVADWFGRLSYPVYLLHGLVHYLLLTSGLGGPAFRIAAATVLTVALATLSNRFLEEPARRFGRAKAA